jgi:hypothetical protein
MAVVDCHRNTPVGCNTHSTLADSKRKLGAACVYNLKPLKLEAKNRGCEKWV